MLDNGIPSWQLIHTLVFDFDGVFTDNKVWVDQDGNESVRCDRADGLAFDMLRRFIRHNDWDLDYFILSTERSKVVSARAKKLLIPCHQEVRDKAAHIGKYLNKNNKHGAGLIYVGNDLNDLKVMKISGYSIAPSDAHPLIKQRADLVLPSKGGEGFVREIIERIIGLDQMSSSIFLKQNLI